MLSEQQTSRSAELFQDWQKHDFTALDQAWKHLAGLKATRSHQLAYIERPRGHSKTSDMAIQLAWILAYGRRSVNGIAAAADQQQAGLIREAIERLIRLNPYLCQPLELRQNAIINPETGSKLSIISSDVKSSWGLLPDFVICDELCHWEKPELWESLFSAVAKKPNALLAILTNAGVGRDWQWRLREHARTSDTWHFSSLDGPQAPWITDAWLAEQRRLLPTSVYDRLWNNRWQHSSGTFVLPEQIEACRDENRISQHSGESTTRYFAAIDYAEKHDFTVGALIHTEGDKVVVDRMDVATPKPGSPVLVSWVEDWMLSISKQFPHTTFILDEYQLLSIIQKYGSRLDIHRFPFRGGQGNHKLALNLRSLIVNRQLAWYPGCGQNPNERSKDNLETELASVLLNQTSSGRCRIDHIADGTHHDDRVFALGAACLAAMEQASNKDEWITTTPPASDGTFAW